MQLKSKAEIQEAVSIARSVMGFAAVDGPDDAADRVMALCHPVTQMYGNFAAVPLMTIVMLVMQIIPIIFGEGGFTMEKFQAVLQLIMSIFQ